MQQSLLTNTNLSQDIIKSDRWSCIGHFGSAPKLCAFHSAIIADTFYPFKLPLETMTSTIDIVFSKTHRMLYGMAGDNIYGIDFNAKRLKWTQLDGTLIKWRARTGICMVDNDRFIARLGGFSCEPGADRAAELYALNCHRSIKISDLCKPRRWPFSTYSNKFHKIIVGGSKHGIEWYDINKDCWNIITENIEMKRLRDMHISPINPNVIILIGYTYESFIDTTIGS